MQPDSKGYDSVPSQPAAPANFSLMDLMSSLAEPGPGTEREADRVLVEEQLTSIHLGQDRALFCMQPLSVVRGGLLQGTGDWQCWDGVTGWRGGSRRAPRSSNLQSEHRQWQIMQG